MQVLGAFFELYGSSKLRPVQQPTEEEESGEESGEASGEESGEVALMGDASQQAGEDEGEGQEASGDEALSLDKLAAQELGTSKRPRRAIASSSSSSPPADPTLDSSGDEIVHLKRPCI